MDALSEAVAAPVATKPAPAAPSPTRVTLRPGDPAPTFQQRASNNPTFGFDLAAGRYIVLCFFASSSDPLSRAAIDTALANRHLFDDEKASFFGVSLDPRDEAENRVAETLPGIRYFWDFDGAVSQLYGSVPTNAEAGRKVQARRFWMVLDPNLRVRAIFPIAADFDPARVMTYVAELPPVSKYVGFEIQAPVLILPNVFEPEFCRHLVDLYETNGGEESGFMRQVDGKTVGVLNHAFKSRKDYIINDPAIVSATQARIRRRILPEILKVHYFKITRMERYIVSCYAADEGGHFQAHRDNTTAGTAHRRFAVSINLNDEFEGGEISFPEYGPRSYKAPTGGAVVFSCTLLHAVSKVTKGRRYAFLPFLYDDEAAKIRAANNEFLDDSVQKYAGAPA